MIKKYSKIVRSGISTLIKKGAMHILIGSFVVKFVAMFSSAFYSRLFEKGDYGVLGYVENLFGYALLIAGLGLTNAVYRYVVKADSMEKKLSYYSFAVKRAFLYDLIITVLAMGFFAFIYPHNPDFSRARYLMAIILLALPFQSLFNTSLACLRSLYDNKRYAVYSCVSSIAFILMKFLFAYLFSLDGVFFARGIVYFVFAALMLCVLRKKHFAGASVFKAQPLTTAEKKEVHSYSFQYMITNGIWHLFALNEVMMLGWFGTDVDVANYRVAMILPSCLSLLSSAISIFVTPYFIKHENDHKWVRSTLAKTIIAISLLVVPAGILMCVLGRWLLNIYNPAYVDVTPLMCVLVLSASVNLIFRSNIANVLAATGKITSNMIVSFGGVALQMLTIIFFTGKFGAFGIAWTSVGLYVLMTIALIFPFNKFFGRKTDTLPGGTKSDGSIDNQQV